MNSPVIYRIATIEDYANINYLHSKVNDLNASFAPFILQHSDVALEQEIFEKIINDEGSLTLIALDEDKVIGFLMAEIRYSANIPALKKRTFVHVSHFGVENIYRRSRIGTELFELCISWAKGKKCNDVEVMVMNENDIAILFYESVGLKSIKRIYNLHIEE